MLDSVCLGHGGTKLGVWQVRAGFEKFCASQGAGLESTGCLSMAGLEGSPALAWRGIDPEKGLDKTVFKPLTDAFE